jgi:DNA-binding transcriptional LysR family regulator
MPVSLKQLQHAVALADAGTYSAAARELRISQPALTRSIQALEKQTGARLFDRTRARVGLTAVGELVVARARVIISSTADLEREVGMTLGLSAGSLKVGVAPYPAQISVAAACGRLVARYPDLELDVQAGNWQALTNRVLDGRIDVAVADLAEAREDERLTTESLPQHQGHLVVRDGHPLAGKAGLVFEDILEYPLVASPLPARLKALKASVRVDTFHLMQTILQSSDAVGLAAMEEVAPAPGAVPLVRLAVDLPSLVSDYGFIRLRGRTPSPAETAFMEFTRQVEAEITGKSGVDAQ